MFGHCTSTTGMSWHLSFSLRKSDCWGENAGSSWELVSSFLANLAIHYYSTGFHLHFIFYLECCFKMHAQKISQKITVEKWRVLFLSRQINKTVQPRGFCPHLRCKTTESGTVSCSSSWLFINKGPCLRSSSALWSDRCKFRETQFILHNIEEQNLLQVYFFLLPFISRNVHIEPWCKHLDSKVWKVFAVLLCPTITVYRIFFFKAKSSS